MRGKPTTAACTMPIVPKATQIKRGGILSRYQGESQQSESKESTAVVIVVVNTRYLRCSKVLPDTRGLQETVMFGCPFSKRSVQLGILEYRNVSVRCT